MCRRRILFVYEGFTRRCSHGKIFPTVRDDLQGKEVGEMRNLKSLTDRLPGIAAIRRMRKLRRRWRREFFEEIRDIAKHPVVKHMKKYTHHGKTTCYRHCLNVAYYNYWLCRLLRLDARSAARAGMLHDLFLYDWHTHAARTGDHFHGLTHPGAAYRNARRNFRLNKTEKDIIINHMWPVTFYRMPKTKEGWLTTFTDKYCGAFETTRRK